MCHSFLIVYYWNDTEFLTLPEIYSTYPMSRQRHEKQHSVVKYGYADYPANHPLRHGGSHTKQIPPETLSL